VNLFFNSSKAALLVASLEIACLRRPDILDGEDGSAEVGDMSEPPALELGRVVRGVDIRDLGCPPVETSTGSSSSFLQYSKSVKM